MVTATLISRAIGFALPAAGAGITRRIGVVFAENAGTTFSSIRFSPRKMSFTARNWTGSSFVSSTPPAFSVKVARNGDGRNGAPNGTSGS